MESHEEKSCDNMKIMDRIKLKLAERKYKKELQKPYKKRMKIWSVGREMYCIRMKDGRKEYVMIPDYNSFSHTVQEYKNLKIDEDKIRKKDNEWLDNNKDKDPEELI